jgi:hypothetical protein
MSRRRTAPGARGTRCRLRPPAVRAGSAASQSVTQPVSQSATPVPSVSQSAMSVPSQHIMKPSKSQSCTHWRLIPPQPSSTPAASLACVRPHTGARHVWNIAGACFMFLQSGQKTLLQNACSRYMLDGPHMMVTQQRSHRLLPPSYVTRAALSAMIAYIWVGCLRTSTHLQQQATYLQPPQQPPAVQDCSPQGLMAQCKADDCNCPAACPVLEVCMCR